PSNSWPRFRIALFLSIPAIETTSGRISLVFSNILDLICDGRESHANVVRAINIPRDKANSPIRIERSLADFIFFLLKPRVSLKQTPRGNIFLGWLRAKQKRLEKYAVS